MKPDQSSDRRDIVAGAKSQNSTLFERVASILDKARDNVVRSVNNQMIIAYWIGREIVQELQSGDNRAEYGK